MIVKAEPDDTVTAANHVAVREYILQAIEKGRMNFSGWPLETFHAIPESPDPDGQATALLGAWLDRHMVKKTRAMMFGELREAQFEAAKKAAEVILSQETRNALKRYRDRAFGEGQGSMELAVKQLLEMAGRTLPREAHQLLETYRVRKGLKSLGEAVRSLVDLAERTSAGSPVSAPVVTAPRHTGERVLHREVKALLQELKTPKAMTHSGGVEP